MADQHKELTALESQRPTVASTPFDSTKKRHYEQVLGETVAQRNKLLLDNKQKENQVNAQIYEQQTRQNKLHTIISAGLTAKTEASKHAAKVLKLRQNVCPTCEQNWNTDSIKKEESNLLEIIGKLGKMVSEGADAEIELINVVKPNIENLQNSMPHVVPDGYKELLDKEREIKNLVSEECKAESAHNALQQSAGKEIQDAFALSHRLMRDRHALDAEQCRGQAAMDQKVLEAAVAKMKAFDETRKRYDQSFGSLMAQEHNYALQIHNISQELSTVYHDIEYQEELKRAVKSYLSCSFDEALETIGENATKLARSVPNMANATIQLMGVWETKEGKVKEEVNAVVNLDGDENIDIRSLCGGERSAIDLAIDLSVIELIESKTNNGINLFILDEPFTGMDSVCIEMALEVLKNSSNNKKLIIVDHNPEVKEMVESRLLVERTGQVSKIIQN